MANTIAIKLDLKNEQFKRDLDKSSNKLASFGKKFAVGIGVAGAAGFAAFQAIQPLIGAASDLGEEISKSEQIFGDAAKPLQDWADGAARAAGLSETAALQFASNFGQFGQAAGLGGEELADFSTDLVGLAADLASFNNLDVEDAAAKLTSGLSGQAEPLRELGIFMSAAEVQAKGLELGLGDLNGQLSEQDKIMARQAIIFEQTSNAQGDFARTSGGLANQSRILSAEWQNLQADLGQKLLPIMLTVVKFINEAIIPAIRDLATWLGENVPAAVEALRKFWEPAFAIIEAQFRQMFAVFQLLVAIFTGDWEGAWQAIKDLFGAIIDEIQAKFQLAWAVIDTLFGDLIAWFGELPGRIVDALGDLGMILYDAGKAVLNGLWEGMKAQWDSMTGWLSSLGGSIVNLKGPPETDAKLLVGNGQLIMQGLQVGMQSGFNDKVVPTLTGITSSIGAGAVGRQSSSAPIGGSQTIQIMLDGKVLTEAIVADSQRRGGAPIRIRAAA